MPSSQDGGLHEVLVRRAQALADDDLGGRIRLALSVNQMGIPDLSREMQKDYSTVYAWVTGRRIPSARTLKRISETLGVRLSWLLGE